MASLSNEFGGSAEVNTGLVFGEGAAEEEVQRPGRIVALSETL